MSWISAGSTFSWKRTFLDFGGNGGALIVIAIPIAIAGDRRAEKGVALYNDGVLQSKTIQVGFQFRVIPAGVGIRMSF